MPLLGKPNLARNPVSDYIGLSCDTVIRQGLEFMYDGYSVVFFAGAELRFCCVVIKAQTPLLRFVVDLLYNEKSTTNRSDGVWA